jgi:hypothetical protein
MSAVTDAALAHLKEKYAGFGANFEPKSVPSNVSRETSQIDGSNLPHKHAKMYAKEAAMMTPKQVFRRALTDASFREWVEARDAAREAQAPPAPVTAPAAQDNAPSMPDGGTSAVGHAGRAALRARYAGIEAVKAGAEIGPGRRTGTDTHVRDL